MMWNGFLVVLEPGMFVVKWRNGIHKAGSMAFGIVLRCMLFLIINVSKNMIYYRLSLLEYGMNPEKIESALMSHDPSLQHCNCLGIK